jgi:hypothetical protein
LKQRPSVSVDHIGPLPLRQQPIHDPNSRRFNHPVSRLIRFGWADWTGQRGQWSLSSPAAGREDDPEAESRCWEVTAVGSTDTSDVRSRVLIEHLDAIVATAARAPSVHNTQPWRFRLSGSVLELHADPTRRLDRTDPRGREMLISCGAALFGLRLAVRELGYRPVVELLPSRTWPHLLARVRLGGLLPMRAGEQRLLDATRRRHTHRGAFAAEPLPDGLLVALQRDAESEAATLMLVRAGDRYGQLATLVAAAERRQRQHPTVAGELRAWTRPRNAWLRDGVPALAFPPSPGRQHDSLAQRDFDLGRAWGTLNATGHGPEVTAVLTTPGDGPVDWLHAGQALHRLLLHAAGEWVFATLHTQPLELPLLRAAVRTHLRLAGAPQMVLQLGRARIAALTARRPTSELLMP